MAVDESALLNGYLVVGAMLFGLGVVGFLSRRNMILMFLAAEIMLQGVSLSLTAWGRYHNNFGGQMLVLLIITVAACEAAIALAMILMLFQRRGSLDIALWEELREANLPPYLDRQVAEEAPEEPPAWPKLPAAGRAPEIPREQTDYRPHV
jgi:NADH-quinone oxidoreductase subunit K